MSESPSRNFSLPPDWVEQRREDTGKVYYSHLKLPEPTEDHPGAWKECLDKKRNKKFYHNRLSKKSIWIRPIPEELYFVESIQTISKQCVSPTEPVRGKLNQQNDVSTLSEKASTPFENVPAESKIQAILPSSKTKLDNVSRGKKPIHHTIPKTLSFDETWLAPPH